MQLGAISQRINNTRQIESIIVAMRALAAAHLREARRHIEAIRHHEAAVSSALSKVLAWLADGGPDREQGVAGPASLLIVIGAGQGFCGLFNETIVQAALGPNSGLPPEAEHFVIGQRCAGEFTARGKEPVLAFDQAARAVDIPRLASLVADRLYDRMADGDVSEVAIVFADPDLREPVRRRLVPFDYSRFESAPLHERPLTQLPLAVLLDGLVQEFIFSEICEALMLGFAAENNARMQAMLRARSNVSRVIEDLERDYSQARQEHTTAEIVELSES